MFLNIWNNVLLMFKVSFLCFKYIPVMVDHFIFVNEHQLIYTLYNVLVKCAHFNKKTSFTPGIDQTDNLKMEKAMKYYLFLYFTYILFYSLYKTIPKQKLINNKIVGFLVIFLLKLHRLIIPSSHLTDQIAHNINYHRKYPCEFCHITFENRPFSMEKSIVNLVNARRYVCGYKSIFSMVVQQNKNYLYSSSGWIK